MGICDNPKAAMNEQQEMPVVLNSPSPRFRYWVSPPESVTLKVADIEPFVPRSSWKVPPPADLTVEIPTGKIFPKNVPRIPVSLLAELLPDHISSSDGMVKLPAAKLAAAYHLVECSEELIPEPMPEPETIPEPEVFAEPEALVDVQKARAPRVIPLIPQPIVAPEPTSLGSAVLEPAPLPPAVPEAETAVEAWNPAPEASATESLDVAPILPQPPAPDDSAAAPAKFPAKRLGSFVRLPLFRRKTAAVPLTPPEPSDSRVSLPPFKSRQEPTAPDLDSPIPPSAPVEEPPADESEPISQMEPEPSVPPAFVEIPAASEPFPQIEPTPDAQPPSPPPVRMLRTEHFPRESQNQEIVEQEPLQALFLTEETMTVSRVIELCGGLPGINSCVLAHGSIVVASHNVPDSIDLVSMSAHASEMLQAMRDSSARMGIGTVPAVTLHTEKGVISFFNREDLTMLVFHRDRGFVPGVREKMAAVLGELAKARLTLPVSSDEDP